MLGANSVVDCYKVRHVGLYASVSVLIRLISRHQFHARLNMSCYCGMIPYWAYPLQYQTPYVAPSAPYPNYYIPMGYVYPAYTPQIPPTAVAAPPAYFATVPARGEYRVGNCLMVCQ